MTAPQTLTMAGALNSALRNRLEHDDKVVVMGMDVGKLGGVFRITDGLQKDFGEDRIIDCPLGESGIIGSAIGLAIRGYRPVCEIQFDGFVYPAFDQIVSQLAKIHNRSLGQVRMPVTIRIPYGGGIGAVEHHSESPEAYFAHTAGLKVVTCANPSDAYWMLRQSIDSDDPVIFFEPKRRYWTKGPVSAHGDVAPLPLHQAQIVRPGSDATLLAYGPMVATALQAAKAAEEDGRDLEVIDLRSLSPIDTATVVASVERTGRLVVVHEASVSLGMGAEIAARIQEHAFYSLQAPVLRVGGFDTPYPASRAEDEWLPDTDRILDAVDRTFSF
ncbi:alpha-ketoacid dehydrogenase subunit beta [Jatrophihabitans telluris]|uniref:Alpha-ketoacid dehydrogenase subunit beta n=1 Tax=Jatrophihabitans telluris TaxID=2038343 RepID=A0ABY4QXG5_9ACTN|nr:alpha-ketoacid dehydrogenase subunit beta [Jatrophihabitans telluris]UQX88376.1 alpha-ketoacid dehydrogenase subunit beta [Jatrophihabitans telluris]